MTHIPRPKKKNNINYKTLASFTVDMSTCIMSSRLVRQTADTSSRCCREVFELVVYEDYEPNVVFTFWTNDFELPT